MNQFRSEGAGGANNPAGVASPTQADGGEREALAERATTPADEAVGAYVPGQYLNTCTTCGSVFQGHKRCGSCRGCALAFALRSSPPSEAAGRETAREALIEALLLSDDHIADTYGVSDPDEALTAQQAEDIAERLLESPRLLAILALQPAAQPVARPGGVGEALSILKEWTPTLETARVDLCESLANVPEGNDEEAEQALTLLGDIVQRATAALTRPPEQDVAGVVEALREGLENPFPISVSLSRKQAKAALASLTGAQQ